MKRKILTIYLLLINFVLASNQNLIKNSSFEDIVPKHWKNITWEGDKVQFNYKEKGRENGSCIGLFAKNLINAAWQTIVTVQPNSDYTLSGWIKTKKVKLHNGKGAMIALDFDQDKVKKLSGNNDWTHVSFNFNSGNRDRINVYCLLGGHGTVSGEAWFDDIKLVPVQQSITQGQMELESITVVSRDIPLLINKRNNQLLKINIQTKGSENPLVLNKLNFDLSNNNLENIQNLYVYYSGNISEFKNEKQYGNSQIPTDKITFTGNLILKPGDNNFWLSCELSNDANQLDKISTKCISAEIKNQLHQIKQDKITRQRIGYTLRKHNDDGVNTYRIPGIITTNKGTLISVYDIRRNSSRDLQGDIDIGMSRSTDSGKTWEGMQKIMDRHSWGGKSEKENGVGDPSILYDNVTNTIWVAAMWHHGFEGQMTWHASQQGLEPGQTGQILLTKSTDDGKTWSDLINITKQVKDPSWQLCLQGPGSGITTSNGTLIFPSQYKDEDKMPHSTILYSKDHGKSWKMGKGAKPNTTEAQVVELSDGSLMLNMRDNRGGSRSVYITKDYGETWTEHPSSRKILPEPVCNAGLINTTTTINGKKQSVLIFINPNTTKGRNMMTLKASLDEGKTWPENYQILLDDDYGFGYPNLTMVDDKTIGILYESSQAHITFQKVLLEELLGGF